MTLAIEAPTDAQLGYIASLCREHGHADERFAEMIGAGEWLEAAVPNLADFEGPESRP